MENLTEKQQFVFDLFEQGLSEYAISKKLNIGYKTVICHLWQAHKKSNTKTPVPQNFNLNAVSVLHDSEGNVKMQWSKAEKNKSIDQDVLIEYLNERIPVNKCKIKKPKKVNEDLMLEIPIFDMHHAMLSWEKETGANYNCKISRHLQEHACEILLSYYGFVSEIVIHIGGDNQTADNRSFMTEKSGNRLDSDSRYAKMAWTTYEANLTCIEMAKKMAKKVTVIVVPGNHDETAAIHLTIQLHAYFRNDSQVKINISPEPHKFYEWGNTVFMTTHGQMNEKQMATYALNQVIKRNYRDVERVMVRAGHLHKRARKAPDGLTEVDGVIIERFSTLAPNEAYAVESGYTNQRALSSILWHKKYGRYGGREVSIGEIFDKYPL